MGAGWECSPMGKGKKSGAYFFLSREGMDEYASGYNLEMALCHPKQPIDGRLMQLSGNFLSLPQPTETNADEYSGEKNIMEPASQKLFFSLDKATW